MRAFLAILGALGLLGGLYLGLADRLRRPVLRLALELEPSNPDDEARAAGLALAIQDYEERAGRWRLAAAHQTRPRNGVVAFPEPRAHTMMYGLEAPSTLPGPEGPLLLVLGQEREDVTRGWMKARGLEKLVGFGPDYASSYAPLRAGPVNPRTLQRAAKILESRPDVVALTGWFSPDPETFLALRTAGFDGPVFLRTNWISTASLRNLDGAFIVLAPPRPAPAEFRRRHPHPFAYAAYEGARTYFDALDVDPSVDPLELARRLGSRSVYELYRDTPRVYEVKSGRLAESTPSR